MIEQKNRSSFRFGENGKEEFWKGEPRYEEIHIGICDEWQPCVGTFDHKKGQFKD